MTPHIVILFAGRLPSEKAAGLFADLNARSFASAGVTVLAPRRLGRGKAMSVPYSIQYVPTLDLSRVPIIASLANYITVFVFSLSALVWVTRGTTSNTTIISNDAFPLIVASLVRKNLMYEMHDFADRSLWMYRLLFRRVRWILVTNEWKRRQLIEGFDIPTKKIVVERNAVDTDRFGTTDRTAARRQLNLDVGKRIAVYTGHLYEWKGADTLAAAAQFVPEAEFAFVGGTDTDVARFKQRWGSSANIRIVGHVTHDRVPLWQSAADVLVLPNSAKEEISVHYTSPMKLFEYMASARPIVASDLPSIREVLPEGVGYFAIPDDPASLAEQVKSALSDGSAGERGRRAREIVAEFTWDKRARRILTLLV
jgi:glycosyltransferase involved in cell wall biosynthesis